MPIKFQAKPVYGIQGLLAKKRLKKCVNKKERNKLELFFKCWQLTYWLLAQGNVHFKEFEQVVDRQSAGQAKVKRA